MNGDGAGPPPPRRSGEGPRKRVRRGGLVGIDTPYIDAVLGLIQQRGRSMGVYPTFIPPESIDFAEWRAD